MNEQSYRNNTPKFHDFFFITNYDYVFILFVFYDKNAEMFIPTYLHKNIIKFNIKILIN